MGGFETDNFDEESLFCSECTEDYWLKEKIRKHGVQTRCSICESETEYAISFEILASWLEIIWRDWFQLGREIPKFHEDSDKVYYDQRGDDAELLISELVQCTVDHDKVIRALGPFKSSSKNFLPSANGLALGRGSTGVRNRV